MRQIIFALISLLFFLISSGALAATLKQSRCCIRRLGQKQFGFSLQAVSSAPALNQMIVMPGDADRHILGLGDAARKNYWIFKDSGGRVIPPEASLAFTPFRATGRDAGGGWQPDPEDTAFVRMEQDKAAYIHALLSTRRERFSDDS